MDKPGVAQKAPIGIDVVEGEQYNWCACGMSKNQPFCAGSHQGSVFLPFK